MQPEGGRVASTLAERELSVGKASLLEYSWDEPLDVIGPRATSFRVDYALMPRRRQSWLVGFPEYWPDYDFEPIGQVFLLPPGHQMRARGNCQRNLSVVCEIDPTYINSRLSAEIAWTPSRLRGCLDIASVPIRSAMLRLREELLNPGNTTQALCEALAVQIAIDLGRYCERLQTSDRAGGLAKWRLQLIDERIANWGSPPRLRDLAALCKMSERHLTRSFRESRGCSLGSYIAGRQLDRAKVLMAEDRTIKEVAHSIGFAAPANFSSTFRRVTGVTPRQYRESIGRHKALQDCSADMSG